MQLYIVNSCHTRSTMQNNGSCSWHFRWQAGSYRREYGGKLTTTAWDALRLAYLLYRLWTMFVTFFFIVINKRPTCSFQFARLAEKGAAGPPDYLVYGPPWTTFTMRILGIYNYFYFKFLDNYMFIISQNETYSMKNLILPWACPLYLSSLHDFYEFPCVK